VSAEQGAGILGTSGAKLPAGEDRSKGPSSM
jgi:hypothetical protein